MWIPRNLFIIPNVDCQIHDARYPHQTHRQLVLGRFYLQLRMVTSHCLQNRQEMGISENEKSPGFSYAENWLTDWYPVDLTPRDPMHILVNYPK